MKLHTPMNIGRQKTWGFTIVELLMYMGLVVILLAVLTSIFLSALEAQLSSHASSASLTAGRFILSRLEYDLHRASSVTVPSSLGESGSSLTLSIEGNDYVFSPQGNNLILTVAGETTVLNETGTTVSGLEFTKLGNFGGKPTVTVSFTVTGTDSQVPEVRTFETSIGLR